MKRARVLFLVACSGALAVACQLVAGIERVEKVPFPADAAASDVEVDSFVPDPCTHAKAPARPPVDDDPQTELPPFVLAMDSFLLRPSGDAGVPGFDLDGVCSCDERPGADRRNACVPQGSLFCDDDGGVDNHFQKAFAFLDSLPPGTVESADKRIREGQETLLAFVRKYNGRANDRDVEVGLVRSDGILSQGCASSVQDVDGIHWTAGFCGDDVWSVPPGSLSAGFPTLYASGHVTDYRLVVALDRAGALPFGDRALEIGSPVTVGRLVPLGEDLKERDPSRPATAREKRLWKLVDGTIAGRLGASDILSAAGSLVQPGSAGQGPDGGSKHLCQSVLYLSISGAVCSNLDIAKSQRLDFQPDYRCDAISATAQFTAFPALAGPEFRRTPGYNECEPADGGPLEPSPFVSTYACAPGDGGL